METAYLGLSQGEGFSPADTLCLLGDSAFRVQKSAMYPKLTLHQHKLWEIWGSCWSPRGALLKTNRRVISTGTLASNCNEIPEIGWLKPIQMHFLTIQDPRIWNPSVLVWMLSEKSVPNLFSSFLWLPATSDIPWPVSSSVQCLVLFSHGVLSLCLCSNFPSVTLIQSSPVVTRWLKKKSHSQARGYNFVLEMQFNPPQYAWNKLCRRWRGRQRRKERNEEKERGWQKKGLCSR